MTKIKGLYARVVSAIVVAIPSIAAITYGYPGFNIFLMVLGGLLAWEWSKLCLGEFKLLGILLAVFVAVTPLLPFVGLSVLESVLFAPVLLAILFAIGPNKKGRLWFALGAVYLSFPMAAFEYLRVVPDHGFELVLWLVLVVVATDTGGYFAGSLIGGPKLAPKISPKKTWAGLLGGMSGALVVTLILGYFVFAWAAPIWLAVCAALLAVLAQIGDLFESHAKRTFEVKDSSNLIPGHGGVLDRLDGMIFAGVAVAALVAFTGGTFLSWF